MTTESFKATMSLALKVFKSHDWYYMMADYPASVRAERDAFESHREFLNLINILPSSEKELMLNLWKAKETYTKCEISIFTNREKTKGCKGALEDTLAKVESLLFG